MAHSDLSNHAVLTDQEGTGTIVFTMLPESLPSDAQAFIELGAAMNSARNLDSWRTG